MKSSFHVLCFLCYVRAMDYTQYSARTCIAFATVWIHYNVRDDLEYLYHWVTSTIFVFVFYCYAWNSVFSHGVGLQSGQCDTCVHTFDIVLCTVSYSWEYSPQPSLKLKFHGRSFLVASSWYPRRLARHTCTLQRFCENVARLLRPACHALTWLVGRMSLGCYEETAPV